MKVIVAQHYGMCFGVRDAIAAAENAAAEGPISVLGELVHNPIVRDRLAMRGVAEANPKLDGCKPSSVFRAGDGDALRSSRAMIAAHGTSDAQRQRWRAAGLQLLDATCPLVRQAHTQLRALVRAAYFPVVIGKRGHVEIVGLTGDFPDAIVIEREEQIAMLPDRPRFGIISQTTQPIDRVRRLVASIRAARPRAEVRFVDTVCKPTKDRQLALRELVAATEVVVVVGGRTSNNTRELVESVRAAGKCAIHIERAEELVRSDFAGLTSVGVTAGTSTLRETVEQVVRRLEGF